MIRPMARTPAQAIAANASAVRMCTFGIPFRFPADPPAFCWLANYKSATSKVNILVVPVFCRIPSPPAKTEQSARPGSPDVPIVRQTYPNAAFTLISTTAALCATPNHDLSWPAADALVRIACCGRPRSASRAAQPSSSAAHAVFSAIGSWTVCGDAAG
jgi:hypothetical protein